MLTVKQEKFVQNIIAGMSQADAYRSAYSCKKMSDNAIHREASILMDNPKITQRVQELRERMEDEAIMTAKERLKWLTEVVKSEKEKTDTKLKAVDIMNKMQGEYVTKVQGDITVHKKLEDIL